MVCIHVGTWLNRKKTPEMNCSTSAMGVTIADADRPFLARLEIAMPSSVHAAEPSTATQTNVSHSAARRQVDAVEDGADREQDAPRSGR